MQIKLSTMILNNTKNQEFNQFKLDENVKQVLLGSILGDGSLSIPKGGINAFYREIHSIKQKDYLLWKYKKLKIFNPRIRERSIFDKRTNKRYYQLLLWTKTHPILTNCHNNVYRNNNKRVFIDLLKQINSLGLAIWYMDDGCYHYSEYRCHLATDCYIYEEQLMIKKWLKENFKIEVQIHRRKKRNKSTYTIAIPRKSTNRFLKIIEPHIIQCMEYKLGHIKKENLSKIKIHVKKTRAYKKKKYEENREEDNKKSRDYYKANKEKQLKYKKEYYLKNKEQILRNNNKYYIKNKNNIRKKQKRYYLNNKDKFRKSKEAKKWNSLSIAQMLNKLENYMILD